MKIMHRAVPLFLALMVVVGLSALDARAQSNLSAYFGVGTAWDGSTGGCIYTGYPGEAAGPCSYNGFATGGYATPGLGGLFGSFGADFMFSHHLGVGGEYSWRFSQGAFGDVNYRPSNYDFNAIYHPLSKATRVVPEIQGGVGGFDDKFYLPNSCGTETCIGAQYFNKPDHFQIHIGIGAKIYVKGGVFVKPQFDIHIVPHLSGSISSTGEPSGQFGSDWVPEATVSVGYTFGGR